MELVTIHWLPTCAACGLAAFQEAPGPGVDEVLSEYPTELLAGQLMIICQDTKTNRPVITQKKWPAVPVLKFTVNH